MEKNGCVVLVLLLVKGCYLVCLFDQPTWKEIFIFCNFHTNYFEHADFLSVAENSMRNGFHLLHLKN